MITLEKLSSNNKEKFDQMLKENMSKFTYDKDYNKEYNKMNFFNKMIIKKFVRLLKIKDIYIGYIWYNPPVDNEIKVLALFVLPKYIHFLDENTLLYFSKYKLTYEAYEENIKVTTLEKLGFERKVKTILMITKLKEMDFQKFKFNRDATLIKFNRNIHEGERCYLQNQIFASNDRIPITIEDVQNEYNQEYYINDLAMFIAKYRSLIGFGQVIYNRELFTVVNFGILEGYRRRGYGESLLYGILNRAKDLGLNEIYIRVEEGNDIAYRLYRKVGFVKVGIIYRWENNLCK